MRNLSFDIKNASDFFKKLLEDHEEFKKEPLSSRLAINCAMTAWHIIDWIYWEYHSSDSSLSKFQIKMKNECPSLQIMHDITNGAKHYKLTRHMPEVKDTSLHKGGFSSGFSLGFNISILVLEKEDGSILYFEEEIANVVLFWQGYFINKQ
jgi:hypothetical protein